MSHLTKSFRVAQLSSGALGALFLALPASAQDGADTTAAEEEGNVIIVTGSIRGSLENGPCALCGHRFTVAV